MRSPARPNTCAHLLVLVQDGIGRCVRVKGCGAQRLGPRAREPEAGVGGVRGAWGTGHNQDVHTKA